jgi:hypothetical protein
MTKDGVIVIHAQRFRTQERNRADAIDRLLELLREALMRPTPRRATKPTFGSKQRRLEGKKRRSDVKARRNTRASTIETSTPHRSARGFDAIALWMSGTGRPHSRTRFCSGVKQPATTTACLLRPKVRARNGDVNDKAARGTGNRAGIWRRVGCRGHGRPTNAAARREAEQPGAPTIADLKELN